MRKPVFLSFHYDRDASRVQQIKNMGALDEQHILSSNEWEQVKRQGDRAIQNWIDEGLKYKRCTVVLVGQETASRKWVRYEIAQSWALGKAVVGIRIHGLKNIINNGNPEIDQPGANPFDLVATTRNRVLLHDPYGSDSKERYNHIASNIAGWVDAAIELRKVW